VMRRVLCKRSAERCSRALSLRRRSMDAALCRMMKRHLREIVPRDRYALNMLLSHRRLTPPSCHAYAILLSPYLSVMRGDALATQRFICPTRCRRTFAQI
jgi:hypothetical protein